MIVHFHHVLWKENLIGLLVSGLRTMADDWDEEGEVGAAAAPVPTLAELPEIKLFGKWSCDEVNISDMSLQVSLSSNIYQSPLRLQ